MDSASTAQVHAGPPQTMTREFSVSLWPYDAKLADLYEKIADTHDEIAKHLLVRTGDG